MSVQDMLKTLRLQKGVCKAQAEDICACDGNGVAVKLEIIAEKGSFLRIELWLPTVWNGDFLGIGNGGMAGEIRRDELASYAKRGFACANADLGTSRGRASGIHNPAVAKDFGYRANA